MTGTLHLSPHYILPRHIRRRREGKQRCPPQEIHGIVPLSLVPRAHAKHRHEQEPDGQDRPVAPRQPPAE